MFTVHNHGWLSMVQYCYTMLYPQYWIIIGSFYKVNPGLINPNGCLFGGVSFELCFFGCSRSIHWQHISTRTLRNGVLPRDLPTLGICLGRCLRNASARLFSLMLYNLDSCFAIHQRLRDLPTRTCLRKCLRTPTPHRESPTQPYWSSIFI